MTWRTRRVLFLVGAGGFAAALAGFLSGCGPPSENVEIPFAVRFGETPIGCTTPAAGLALTDLRLFVHDLRLIGADGREMPVRLADEPPWQGAGVALLDLEDGAGACLNGSAATRSIVHGVVEAGDYRGLAFVVGVPEALNHGDPLRAPPPLDIQAMHWHWLTGYKFLRAGVASDTDAFWIHLGSTRCEGTATEPRGCADSNRPRVRLPDFVPGESRVVLDLELLAAQAGLDDGVPGDCSSGPAEAACDRPFDALGLDFGSGEATGTPPAFRVAGIE